MRTTLHRIGSLSVALAIVALLSVRAQAQLQTPLTVYITNITQGQILSPVVVVTHRAGAAPLFTPGEPASDELAQVAEDAVLQPLVDKLTINGAYLDVEVITGAGGPIMPGETASVQIQSDASNRLISLVGMLVSTNDTFVGLSGVLRPPFGTQSHYAIAYDAKSRAGFLAGTDGRVARFEVR